MAKSAVLIASARMDHKADVLKELRNRQSGVGRRERALHSAIYVYIYIYICSFFFFLVFVLAPRWHILCCFRRQRLQLEKRDL